MFARVTLLCAALALAACAAATPALTAPAATPALRPLPSSTAPRPAVTGTPGREPTPVIIASPTATPTPVTHVVLEGESLLGIAFDYGVSLEALEAANPDVQAQFLSIGTVLVIPPPEGNFAVAATHLAPPPLAPVALGEPTCYPLASGSLVCLLEARNPGAVAVENVSARLTLAGADGLPFTSAVAFAALDLIPAGAALPLAVLFTPRPTQAVAATGVELLTGNVAADPAPPTRAVLLPVTITASGLLAGRWSVAGEVTNPSEQALATSQLALALYDASGALAGYRKQTLAPGLLPGETRAFSLAADVLGGAVEQFTVFAEGRP
ncbi:MAG: LysM peptidoglycan-binding domain-containing protein [Anaerolineales bacterium]|nr:LysM peptidoglycan-binding domain-containing protein [Anaerolineales bacterium]